MQPLVEHNNEDETITTDGKVKDLVSYASSAQPTVTSPKSHPKREIETVSLDIIEANICADKGCI